MSFKISFYIFLDTFIKTCIKVQVEWSSDPETVREGD